jgi:hypothetical protein
LSPHPRPHVQMRKAHERKSPQVQPSHGIPCAMVLTAYFALSPVIGLSCHRRQRDAKASSPTWHQRRDARTTRLRRPRDAVRLSAHPRPSHPAPNVRDDREAPLERVRDRIGLLLFLPKRKAKYFCEQDWTGSISLIRLNYLRGRRSGPGATRSPRRRLSKWNSGSKGPATLLSGH